MARKIHLSTLHRMVDKALASGASRPNFSRVVWDIGGRCTSPHVTEFYARPAGDEGQRMTHNRRQKIVVGRLTQVPMTLELHTPCRRCDTCRKQRQRIWSARARSETIMAARTWFGTLTLRPEAWLLALNQCRAHEAVSGVDFDALPEHERLALIHARVGSEITKMWKRIREASASPLRYLVVLEVTKAGVLHYHCLLHELDGNSPVRHIQLREQWPLGFSKWRLVKDEREAAYVAKYLSKTLLARVRASEGYGSGGSAFFNHSEALAAT